MGWRHGRAMMASLLFAGLGLAGGGWRAPTADREGTPPAACPDPVVVDGAGERTLVCHAEVLILVVALCRPRGAIHRGDRLRFEWSAGRCRIMAEPLTAGHRLRLGLRLDLNRASPAELSRIAGIGPVTARRIVAGRPWASVDGLLAVRGLGPRRLARIAPRLTARALRPLSWPSRPPPAASSPRRP